LKNKRPQILLTNDDGIDSPGLWAAAEALSELGYVWVTAPRDQASGMGRSMPSTSDGEITTKALVVHGKPWTIYSVGGSPAQVVQHAIYEIIPDMPDLVVSGINYGLNLGTGVTVSGTVGAAMEGAANGIPSLAVSLDTAPEYFLSHSADIDFKPAAHFTRFFAQKLLAGGFDPLVEVLKVEIPATATSRTPWEIARLSSVRFYVPIPPSRAGEKGHGGVGYTTESDLSKFSVDSDVHVTLVKGHVAVTPLTLDMTAPVDMGKMEALLKA
jgi:5'-nucleotidase